MLYSFKRKRQWMSHGLVFAFLIGIISIGLTLMVSSPVFAADAGAATEVAAQAARAVCLKTAAVPTTCPPEAIADTSKSIWDKIVTPALKMVAVKALVDFTSFAANRIAYESAVYIANGGPGEGSMFYKKSATEAWEGFGKDIAGEAFGNLSDITAGWGFNLCVPPNPVVRLNIKLSIKQNYTPAKPKCDFDSVTKQWGQVVSDASAFLSNDKDARDKFLFNKLSEGLKPGNNELGATIGFLQLTNETAQKKAELKTAEQIGSISIGGFTNVKDLVTGQTKTPASIVSDQFKDQLKDAKGDENKIKPGDVLAHPDVWYGLLNMSVSTFTNTLTSQLFNRVYKGLFSPQPSKFDPFNTEKAGGAGSDADATKVDLGGIFTATPVANPQFDLLSEFAQCPPDGTGNRSLNSCVLDASVVGAISRGGGTSALTIQEAIDQNVLHGDWPLLPSKNVSANQDRLCYTYGFCYGNLVKLRKARIISIGWEIAAEKNSLSSPTSLQDIVAGFNDPGSKWYHLIDPNWVLKAPESQCRAAVNGEIRVSAQAAGRQNLCVDAPTCIGEDNSGTCTQGFGYCVEEKNIWRVKGDECPAQYATCLTLQNTTTGKSNSLLLNTVDNANCTKQNAGCSWNKTQKVPDAKGDYQWFTGTSAYNIEATSNTFRYAGSTASSYSYEDRLYVTHNAKQCSQEQAGCTELNVKDSKLALNLVQNGSFEKDEDKNNIPDGWTNTNKAAVKFVLDGGAVDGSKSVQANGGYFYQFAQVNPGSFYTLSLYATSTTANQEISVSLYPKTASGAQIPLSGLSFGGDCALSSNSQNYDITKKLTNANEWKRFTCTFTLPNTAKQVEIDLYDLNAGAPKVQYDAVQLEVGEIASTFGDGYNNSSPTKAYLKIPPAYLGCKGLASDPKECTSYAQVCSAQDVGCDLYTPKESGPAVPAIASALDACPNVCVGYDAYRQEGTKYEPAKFPVYFIADKAAVCTKNAVGCDGFTKLAAQGGEMQEHYTYLRACMTPEMADTTPAKTSATYFTWEGSDKSGFQLKTWQLLQSNVSSMKGANVSAAPCITPSLESESSVKCVDQDPVLLDSSCDAHADIFTNADCREFFDNAGEVHYRLFSKTVTVDTACVAYRKNASTSTDCTASGGFWAGQGFCRYFGLQKESKSCSAAENGCREYTGGAGRNATTILTEIFEAGTTGTFVATPSATAVPSTDSTSATGHSLRVNASGNDAGVQTNSTVLTSSLSKGKVYTVQFWAKGSGQLSAGFQDANNGTKHYFVENMDLTAVWNVYDVGPMDTNTFTTFTKDATLFFTTKDNKEFFIDNITLVETEEHITRIKDSWVTPAVCDQSPDGAVSPQYYLGCKAYTDRKGAEGSYYQFSHICSEKVIGCSAYYNTFNSSSASGQVSNARCVNLKGGGTLPLGTAVAGAPVACQIDGVTHCTIGTGQNYCVFSTKQAFADPLPKNTDYAIVYGSEAVVTPQDQSIFLVDDGKSQCSADFKGCREVGAPTYAQDLKTVTKFDSKYVLDTPDDYGKILCENQALFCDEFSSTKDGNFYFKDPLNKTCEYKKAMTIAGKSFSGWFRSGKSEPCYWKDVNTNGKFEPGIDTANLVSGDDAQIWKNGDVAYDGWLGVCESSANRCTEFLDATDTSPENHGKGKSYYVINNDKLTESSVTATQKCEGKVGQKAGCALFNNTTISQLKYNSSASYLVSLHADVLQSKPQNSLVDPISCAQDGGKFAISQETAKKLNDEDQGIEGDPHPTNELSVNLCARRCYYKLPLAGDELLTPSATKPANSIYWNERSCLFNSDCPVLDSKLQKGIQGRCREVAGSALTLKDDANTVLKVNRDRTCAAWLACDSSRTTWDAGSNKYIQICDSVNLCTQTGSQGDQARCQSWTARDPVVMSEKLYASRDVSWAGADYSGYQIPGQLPVERFSQFNLNPKRWCVFNGNVQGHGPNCETNSTCETWSKGAKCEDASSDYRLVYNAGPCAGADKSSCQVGFCKNTKAACASNTNCGIAADPANICVFGYCQEKGVACSDSDKSKCVGTTPICDTVQGVCVDDLLKNPPLDKACSSESPCKDAKKTCITPAPTTAFGLCYQNRCLTDIRDTDGDGFAQPLDKEEADNVQSCRGYPEFDSPFPQKVIKTWKVFPVPSEIKPNSPATSVSVDGKSILNLTSVISSPSQFVSGYDASKVCSPICDKDGKNCVANDNCLCSYTKATYAKGTETRYYPTNFEQNNIPSGVCTGGLKEGKTCFSDVDCTLKTGEKDAQGNEKEITGNCQRLTSTNTMFGWQGYCLEKDSSIQLNGSTAAKDQACLTWLPVDQLSGATDLYGKEMGAGYPLKNTYYCAEPDWVYDLGVSNEICAKSQDTSGFCSENEDGPNYLAEIKDNWETDEPYKVMQCPTGYFAIATSCGKMQNLSKPGDAICGGSTKIAKYPYFCVPKKSFHGGDFTKPCDVPTDVVDKTKKTKENSEIYFVTGGNYPSVKTAFSDCKVPNIRFETAQKKYGLTSILDYKFNNETNIQLYSLDHKEIIVLGLKNTSQKICSSLLQTSSSDQASFNAAWTDRVWNTSGGAYTMYLNVPGNTSDTPFNFQKDKPLDLFGSLNVQSLSSTVLKPSLCDDNNLPDPLKDKSCYNKGKFQQGNGSVFAYWPNLDLTIQDNEPKTHTIQRLSQIFAKAYSLWNWMSGYEEVAMSNPNSVPIAPEYQDKSSENSTWLWGTDILANGDVNGVKPKVPVITSVGNCVGTSCTEKNDGKFSVNGEDAGVIQGTGSKHVSATFYVRADTNQMPLRNIVIDWGDDMKGAIEGGNKWPLGNQSGSIANSNFYKNHRGLSKANPPKELCDGSTFGQAPEACSSSYVLFAHDYVCTSSDVAALQKAERTCGSVDPKTKSIVTSPCVIPNETGKLVCQFQPRIHAKDNWGWCTGYCEGGPNGSKSCFGNSACDIAQCPGGSNCDGKFDPWTYFDGIIRIKPI